MLTPLQKVKLLVLIAATSWKPEEFRIASDATGEQIDECYERARERDPDTIQDASSEVREGQTETGLGGEWSRNYESKAVASKTPAGDWVGWTYWHGGGKHGSPEELPWMEDAYDLTCVEEEKMVTVRTFTKAA